MRSVVLFAVSIMLLMNYGWVSKLGVNRRLKNILLRGLVFFAAVSLLVLFLGFSSASLEELLQEQSLFRVLDFGAMAFCVLFSLIMLIASIAIPFNSFDSWMRRMLNLGDPDRD